MYEMGGRTAFGVLLSGLCVGCGSAQGWMPLEDGWAWQYTIEDRQGAVSRTYNEPWQVGREVAVAGVMGREVKSNLGVLRLGWKGSQLFMSQSTTATFIPAMPIFSAQDGKTEWSGIVKWGSQRLKASAILTMTTAKVDYGAEKELAKISDIVVTLPNQRMGINTTFVEGAGIVRQEQTLNNKSIYEVKLLHVK